LPIKQKAEGHNLVIHNWMPSISFDVFGAAAIDGDFTINSTDATRGPLAFMALTTNSTEVAYTEYIGAQRCDSAAQGVATIVSDRVDANYAFKRFIEDRSEASSIIETEPGREAIRIIERFLWLPSQGNLSNIRSFEVWWSSDEDYPSGAYTWASGYPTLGIAEVCRTRLKDGGVPVTLTKSSDEALLFQYTFTLVAV
jgi:hypothetical protein